MTNIAAVTTEQSNESVVKNKGGRPVDPKSQNSRAKIILENLTPEQFNKNYAVPLLVNELGCKESSAMTIFYTFKAARSKASAA